MPHPCPFLAGILQPLPIVAGTGPPGDLLPWVAGGLGVMLLGLVLLGGWIRLGEAARRASRRREARDRDVARDQARDLEAQIAVRTAALRESEARVQGFIRHAPAAMAVKGVEGGLLLVNRRAEALLGRLPAVTPDRSLPDLFPPDRVAREHDQDERVLLHREEIRAEEGVVLPSGEVQEHLVQKFPLVDALGHGWGVGVIATDITGHKLLEQAQRHRQKLESLGLLAGGLAHDFNNLLSAMAGNLDLARLEPDREEHLQALEDLVTRATGLVGSIATYAGMGAFQVRTLDLNPLVEGMVRVLRASLPRGAALRWEPSPGLPPMAGDPGQIEQVIIDLVLNAAEALGPEGGTVTLRTGAEEVLPGGPYRGLALEAGPHVLLEVSDTGPGMRPEVQERIFDPFFSTKPGGRGLGLSGVRGIVEGLHGGLRVLSGEGRGTTFRLLFPAQGGGAGVPEAQVRDEGFRGWGTVLAVDDEDAVRAVAVRALRRMGFGTLEARDGFQALQVFEAHWDSIRLVIMDLTMPRMGGEEACRALRRSGALAPVILSSGFAQEEALRRFGSMALAGFLQKPYRFQALAAAVRDALEGRGGAPGGPRELVVWVPEFDTGHALLDAQHKGLVRTFNRLVAASEGGGEEARGILEELILGTRAHFAAEEGIMAEAAFPGMGEHRAAHSVLLAQIRDLARQVDQGTPFTAEVLNFLEDWLLEHMQTDDQVLARLLV